MLDRPTLTQTRLALRLVDMDQFLLLLTITSSQSLCSCQPFNVTTSLVTSSLAYETCVKHYTLATKLNSLSTIDFVESRPCRFGLVHTGDKSRPYRRQRRPGIGVAAYTSGTAFAVPLSKVVRQQYTFAVPLFRQHLPPLKEASAPSCA